MVDLIYVIIFMAITMPVIAVLLGDEETVEEIKDLEQKYLWTDTVTTTSEDGTTTTEYLEVEPVTIQTVIPELEDLQYEETTDKDFEDKLKQDCIRLGLTC